MKEAEQQAQKLLDQYELRGFEPVLLASGESSRDVYVAILFQKFVGEKRAREVIGKEEGFKLSKRLSAEVAKLTKLSEDRLYEMIGEALLAQELLKKPTKFLE